MAHINRLIGNINYINMQAHLLQIKSDELMDSALTLQAAVTNAERQAPNTLSMNIDLSADNPLNERVHGTADVITQINRVLDIIIASTKKAEADAKKIGRRNDRRRRRRRNDSDDEIAIVMELRGQN